MVPTDHSYFVLLKAYVALKDLAQIEQIFEEMKAENIVPSKDHDSS